MAAVAQRMMHVGCTWFAAQEGLMPRSMVGLLAAVGAIMSALAVLAHTDVVLVVIAATAGAATGSAAYLAAPLQKKPS
jgi:hypothetical protein